MKTFISNETLLLIDGEVCLTKELPKDISEINTSLIIEHNGCMWLIIASTKQLPNVKQLPREVFVKGVDVDELAEEEVMEIWRFKPESGDELKDFDREVHMFKAGFNAKHNEFTKEEMAKAISRAMFIHVSGKFVDVYGIINDLRPITLPKSITTNDELEIIKIEF